jgi:hypothetical protein
MATSGKATLHGLFSLKENVTLEAFLPALEDYLRHLQAAGYVLRWRVEQRQVLGNFDRGLPEFTHYIAIEFPDLAHDVACYQYVSGRNRSIPCTLPCTSRYDPVHGFSSPTTRPRSKQWPKAGILVWRSRPQGGPCPAYQGRDTRLSTLPMALDGLGVGECRP